MKALPGDGGACGGAARERAAVRSGERRAADRPRRGAGQRRAAGHGSRSARAAPPRAWGWRPGGRAAGVVVARGAVGALRVTRARGAARTPPATRTAAQARSRRLRRSSANSRRSAARTMACSSASACSAAGSRARSCPTHAELLVDLRAPDAAARPTLLERVRAVARRPRRGRAPARSALSLERRHHAARRCRAGASDTAVGARACAARASWASPLRAGRLARRLRRELRGRARRADARRARPDLPRLLRARRADRDREPRRASGADGAADRRPRRGWHRRR